jgi:hypothetical protein
MAAPGLSANPLGTTRNPLTAKPEASFARKIIVGRTMHHANRPTVVPGDPLPGRLTRSQACGGGR